MYNGMQNILIGYTSKKQIIIFFSLHNVIVITSMYTYF